MMEAIGINLAVSDDELLKFLKTTLFWQQRPVDQDETQWIIKEGKFSINFLLLNEIIEKQLKSQDLSSQAPPPD
jgi:hypothetical protein